MLCAIWNRKVRLDLFSFESVAHIFAIYFNVLNRVGIHSNAVPCIVYVNGLQAFIFHLWFLKLFFQIIILWVTIPLKPRLVYVWISWEDLDDLPIIKNDFLIRGYQNSIVMRFYSIVEHRKKSCLIEFIFEFLSLILLVLSLNHPCEYRREKCIDVYLYEYLIII